MSLVCLKNYKKTNMAGVGVSSGVADNEIRQLLRARNEEPRSLHLIFSVIGCDWRILTWGVMWSGLCIKDN